MKRENRKRLAMDVPIKIHDELKMMAVKYNCTITKYVLRTLIAQLRQEWHYDDIMLSEGEEDA